MKLLNIIAVLVLTSITTAYSSIRIENNIDHPIFVTFQGMKCLSVCGHIGTSSYTTRCCGSNEVGAHDFETFEGQGSVTKIYIFTQDKRRQLAQYDCGDSCGTNVIFTFNKDNSITKR